MMERIMKKALYSCVRATELIDRRQIEPLSTLNNLRLNIHLKMCRKCMVYQTESKFLEIQLYKGLMTASKGLSEEDKLRIIKKIKSNL
jgi:hypothetical protein